MTGNANAICGQVKMIAAFPSVLWYTVGMTTLPAELQEMVEHSGDTPVRVVDPKMDVYDQYDVHRPQT